MKHNLGDVNVQGVSLRKDSLDKKNLVDNFLSNDVFVSQDFETCTAAPTEKGHGSLEAPLIMSQVDVLTEHKPTILDHNCEKQHVETKQ